MRSRTSRRFGPKDRRPSRSHYRSGVADTRSTVETPPWFLEPPFAGRFLAFVADGVLMLVVGLLIQMLCGRLGGGGDLELGRRLSFGAAALYVIGGVALKGRTIGKALFGLRVVDVATGALPGLPAAVVRWLVPVLPALMVGLLPETGLLATVRLPLALAPLAIFAGVLLPPLHRGLHDRAAGTIVTSTFERPA